MHNSVSSFLPCWTLIALTAACGIGPALAGPATPKGTSGPAVRAQTEASMGDFNGFFEATPRELKPSAKLLGMNGRRIRLVGFMAKLDAPIQGAFYLCPMPTFGDEEGGGTADLPPQAVRVVVNSYRGRSMPYVPGPVVVTGRFHIGPVPVENGQISMLQLTLDRPVLPDIAHMTPRLSLRKTVSRTASRK